MHRLLILLFVAALIGAVAMFAAAGSRQRQRRRRLAHLAQRLGLEFSATDPFAIAQLHSDFTLVTAGHGARALNVAHGSLDNWRVRAFTFIYEVGHGLRRAARSYSVVVAEIDPGLDRALVWHRQALAQAPLQAGVDGHVVAEWFCTGSEATAERLAEACGAFGDLPVSAEVAREWLMLFVPTGPDERAYTKLLELLPGACRDLCGRQGPRGPMTPDESPELGGGVR